MGDMWTIPVLWFNSGNMEEKVNFEALEVLSCWVDDGASVLCELL